MPAPAHPIIIHTRPKSNAGSAVFTIAAIVIAVAGGIWFFVKENDKPATPPQSPATVEAAPIPESPVSVPVSTPVAKVEPKPVVAAPMPEEKPMQTAAAPLPNVPVPPSPAPVEKDLYEKLLALDGTAARATAEQERSASLLRSALEKNEWPKYLKLLERSLAAELKKNPDFHSVQRYDRYTANPYFMRALLQHTLGTALGDDARRLIAQDQLVRQHMTYVCESTDVLESLLRAWTPGDNGRRVIETWARLAADDADALGTYRELAIACSIVLEKPRTIDYKNDKRTFTAEERYRWFKTKDKAGKLVGKITSMTAWELAWIVGVPIAEEEMEWSLAELSRKLKQSDWGRAYSMVPYDMEKAVTGKMKEPYEYYTFAEILKKGGICGDRAYFSAHSACAAGIPAVQISGDGPRGPHAWITWLADDGRWAFSGRFDGYPAASVRDPRNGARISEQRFTRMSENNAPSNTTRLRAQRLVWIGELQDRIGQKEEAGLALEFALKTSPRQAELWEKKVALWSAQLPPPSPGIWKAFLDSMKREFRDDSDMLKIAREAEDKFLLARGSAELVKNELRGDMRDLSKLKGLTSTEEIRSAHKRYAELVLKTNDYTALRRVYRDALDDYGREAAKFKALTNDYWMLLATAPSPIRLTACRDIEGAYERHVETRGGDFFSVQSQNSAAAVVAKCWREAGDTARAERIEKEIAKRDKKSRDNAL